MPKPKRDKTLPSNISSDGEIFLTIEDGLLTLWDTRSRSDFTIQLTETQKSEIRKAFAK